MAGAGQRIAAVRARRHHRGRDEWSGALYLERPALGAWLGWKLLPLVILLSAASGAVLGILLIVMRGRDRAAPMPFGPYLAAAGWLAMLYGDSLVTGYLRLSGLQR